MEQLKEVEMPDNKTIEPYSDRVVVRKIEVEFKTKGGLFLGQVENDRDTHYGKVVAIGEGKRVDTLGTLPMKTEIGDIVVFNARIPLPLNIKGWEFFIMRESDILLRLKDKDIVEKEFTSEGKEYDIIGAKVLG